MFSKFFIPSFLLILFGWCIPLDGALALSGDGIIPAQKTAIQPANTIAPSLWSALRQIDLTSIRTDGDLYRFVSRNTPLTDKSYEPTPLVSISGSSINQAGRRSMLREDARDALWSLASAFEKKFGEPLVVVSGYRSAAYQQRLWDLGRCTDSLCAPPGQSEHQLGLAVDLFDASTEEMFLTNRRYASYIGWLQENAHLYGWTQSYQKGEYVDGYDVEPWHWRYIGVDMATRLRNLGWSYTEYVRVKSIIGRY